MPRICRRLVVSSSGVSVICRLSARRPEGPFPGFSLSVLSSSSSEGGRLEVDGRTMVRSAAPHEALLFIITTIRRMILLLASTIHSMHKLNYSCVLNIIIIMYEL